MIRIKTLTMLSVYKLNLSTNQHGEARSKNATEVIVEEDITAIKAEAFYKRRKLVLNLLLRWSIFEVFQIPYDSQLILCYRFRWHHCRSYVNQFKD